MDQFVVNANTRTETGKRAAQKMRKSGRLPAVMYNSKGESVMLDIDEAAPDSLAQMLQSLDGVVRVRVIR